MGVWYIFFLLFGYKKRAGRGPGRLSENSKLKIKNEKLKIKNGSESPAGGG